MKYKLFFPFFLILILVSCKDNEIIPENIPTTPESPVYNSDKLYLNINISNNDGLISVTDTRADDENINGKTYAQLAYDDLEKYVVSGNIYIFEEKEVGNESSAICVSSGELKNGTEKDETGIIVKSIYYNNIEVDMFDYEESKTYYALVILNPFDITPPALKQTFSSWATTEQNALMTKSISLIYSGYNGASHHKKLITMTNATGHANHSSGSFTPTTLVKIQPEDLQRYPFKDNYKSHTDIYVQRNVAKVVVKAKEGINGSDKMVKIGKTIDGLKDVQVQINLANFILDVINTRTYPVQNIQSLPNTIWNIERFHSGSNIYDQIYWAVDPNYSDITQSKNKGNFNISNLPANNSVGNPLYCLENTFDIANMLQSQTTRAVIRCRMDWWGENEEQFNTSIKLPSEDYLYDESGEKIPSGSTGSGKNTKTAKAQVSGNGNDFEDNGFFTTGSYENIKLWDLKHLIKALEDKAQEKNIKVSIEIQDNLKNDKNSANLGGYYTINKLLKATPDLEDSQWSEIAPAIGINDILNDKIAYYFNSWVYYFIRIRHFSDEEGADWDGTTKTVNNIQVAEYKNKHLGRYGVLRNNEYEIIINRITELGSPEQFPDIPEDYTDDMPEKLFMEVKIQVKNWNKRQVQFDL